MNSSSREWRAVPGYEGLYEVSSDGEVRSLTRTIRQKTYRGMVTRTYHGKVLTLIVDSCGYRRVNLARHGEFRSTHVHRIVASTFIGELPAGQCTRHGDGDKNNNAVANLSYGSPRDNSRDEMALGRTHTGERNGFAKLTAAQADAIRDSIESGPVLSLRFGVSRTTVNRIRSGKTWKAA